jgi:hypothetical protein
MLQVGHGAFAAFSKVLYTVRKFLLVVHHTRDVPLYPALRDGSKVFWRDLECGEAVLWLERSDCAGDGYTLADHVLVIMMLVIQ